MNNLIAALIFVFASFLIIALGASVWWQAITNLVQRKPPAIRVLALIVGAILFAYAAYTIHSGVWITLVLTYVALTGVKYYELSH